MPEDSKKKKPKADPKKVEVKELPTSPEELTEKQGESEQGAESRGPDPKPGELPMARVKRG